MGYQYSTSNQSFIPHCKLTDTLRRASLTNQKPFYVSNWLTLINMLLIKLTLFLLYLNLFKPLWWLRISIYAGIFVITAVYMAFAITILVFITPKYGQTWVEAFQTPGQSKLISLSVPLASINLAIDCYIFVLPILAVSRLQLSTRRKVGVLLVFATGLGSGYDSHLLTAY